MRCVSIFSLGVISILAIIRFGSAGCRRDEVTADEYVKTFHVHSFGTAKDVARLFIQNEVSESVYVIPETLKVMKMEDGRLLKSKGTIILAEIKNKNLGKANSVYNEVISSHTEESDSRLNTEDNIVDESDESDNNISREEEKPKKKDL